MHFWDFFTWLEKPSWKRSVVSARKSRETSEPLSDLSFCNIKFGA